MTLLKRPVTRKILKRLGHDYGPDRDKRIVITLKPGDGDKIHDMLELRPERTSRTERIAVVDVYRFALRCRVNNELLVKAREKKARKAERLARARQERAEAKLFGKDAIRQISVDRN